MSKMDRQLNSKKDKETIYEIYRACRLCGAGAGYKMPIIQNVVDLDDTDVELRQKVRDCVQIEVHQDDKMPPLICELCVDKVNDFYEFLEMCRQTNKRTRLRLGLPPQSMPRGAPDAGDCILGLTEPVYVNEDSDGEPLSKQKKIMNPKVKVKREPELKVRLEKEILTETRPSRFKKRSPTPPRITRHRINSKEENTSLSRLKDKKLQKPAPKSILKKDTKNEDNSLLASRLKRTRDKEPVKLETPVKKVKITTRTSSTSSSQTPKSSPKTSPRPASSRLSKSPKPSPVRPPSPPRLIKCSVCGQTSKTSQANGNHLRTHTVGFTSPKLACNPCGLWFSSADETAAHHRQHKNKSKPYNCRRCVTDFRQLSSFDEHLEDQCIPFFEVPDVKCDICWHLFATNKLLEDHKCLGEEHRPGGKCSKCRRSYALLKNLKKHELTCTAKKKGEVDPELLGKLRPMQIRISRCDPLLANLNQEHYDVSNVTADFGLDKNCVYPYISSVSSLRIKSDPDGMVDIQDEIKDEFYIEEDYVHWDSEESETDEEDSSILVKKKKIDTLANLTLKTLFSKKCLGKVPKKKRRVKHEKSMFDSLLTGTEDDVTRDINSIIDNLGGDDDDFDGEKADGKKLNDSDKSMDVSDDKRTGDGDKVDDNDSSDKNDVIDSSDVKNDVCDDDVTKDISSASKNVDNVCNDNGSNNNVSSNNDNNSIEGKVNNGTINLNSLSFDYDDGVVISKRKYDVSSPETTESKNDENTKIDYEYSQDSNSIGGGSDSLLNAQNDKESIDKISIDNATSLSEQNSDVDENKSQSADNVSQDSKLSEFDEDKSQNNDKQIDNSQNSDNINDNDYKNAISVIVNSGKTKALTDSEELEDSNLMAALDAEIGESNESRDVITENSQEFSENSKEQINESTRGQTNEDSRGQSNENSREQINDKIGLEDLITAKSDLDLIPEEYFDA